MEEKDRDDIRRLRRRKKAESESTKAESSKVRGEMTAEAKEQARNVATRKNVQALSLTVEFQAKQIEELEIKVRALSNNLGTLQLQFEQFQQQRVRELQARVNGGPTA